MDRGGLVCVWTSMVASLQRLTASGGVRVILLNSLDASTNHTVSSYALTVRVRWGDWCIAYGGCLCGDGLTYDHPLRLAFHAHWLARNYIWRACWLCFWRGGLQSLLTRVNIVNFHRWGWVKLGFMLLNLATLFINETAASDILGIMLPVAALGTEWLHHGLCRCLCHNSFRSWDFIDLFEHLGFKFDQLRLYFLSLASAEVLLATDLFDLLALNWSFHVLTTCLECTELLL